MWLINCANSKYTLEEFLDESAPTYAILSHTWGKEEVSFQQMQCLNANERPAGFAKIQRCCQTAFSQGIKYAWVDTCCIDKTSSSALQESINSMFRWYRRAKVCYAYLSDVSGGVDEIGLEKAFQDSRWFTRGWTLQELIAPEEVWFYDQSWTKCGTKISRKKLISKITGVQQEVLEGANKDLSEYSVAQRMCWASRRITTRQEDMAYCLLGIFDINMTLIYGEGGQRAFIRLQEQIMQDSDDQSIFAWRQVQASVPVRSGLLADSPDLFMTCGDIIALRNWHQCEPFELTNRGLRLNLPLLNDPKIVGDSDSVFLGALACQFKNEHTSVLGIILAKVLYTGDQYFRVNRSLHSIPIDLLTKLPRSDIVGSSQNFAKTASQSLYRWIYVRKQIHYPKTEEIQSPGDLIAFNINLSEYYTWRWTLSSYPANFALESAPVITAPETVHFRWNPAAWSWHAVILFDPQFIYGTLEDKSKFYLVVGWDGRARRAWVHLGQTKREDAKDIYDRYHTDYSEEPCHAIKIRNVIEFTKEYGVRESEVTLSMFEAETTGGLKWYEVDPKIVTNETNYMSKSALANRVVK